MLSSLFGDLGDSREPDDGRKRESTQPDTSFTATGVVESTRAEVNDHGQIIDRHVSDLFVTGSPAQAMREHLASTRTELDRGAHLITLYDPVRIWASAVVKALSDASGQPIERLHLRETGTLRTLAMIERTAIVRRFDDALKIYHADVRATGRENAEIPIALMERSNLTAVIVGSMQPHAIDAMIEDLLAAVYAQSWHCPMLLFMLPPGAVWIANKISGAAWPPALQVRVLTEPMTGASAVWNSVLGVWNQVKSTRSAAIEASAPIAADAAVSRNGATERAVVTSDLEEPVTLSTAALDAERARGALGDLLRTDGLVACAVVDGLTGLVLASQSRSGVTVDFEQAAAACSQLLKTHRLSARDLGLPNDEVDEVIIGAGGRQQVIRVLARHPELFMFALLDKNRTNLALVRFRLQEAEKNLQ